MMQYLPLILVFLLLLWQVYALHSVSFRHASLLRRMIAWTVSMLLLALLLSMSAKKLASESELAELEHSVHRSEAEMLIIPESFLSTKCFSQLQEAVVKAACETEPLHCIILSGILKSKICSCLKTTKEQKTIESDTWTTVCNSTN